MRPGERDIFIKAQIPGDSKEAIEARNKLVELNQGLIGLVVKRYLRWAQMYGIEYGDIFNEGILGLIRAVEKYDINSGNQFSTYAYIKIRQSVYRALAEKSKIIRIPEHRQSDLYKYNKAVVELRSLFEREPLASEIAEETGFTIEKINLIRSAIPGTDSIEEIIRDGEESYCKFLADENNFSPLELAEIENLADILREAINQLNARQQFVVKSLFGIDCARDYNLEEVAKEIKITREGVRQIRERAFKKIREIFKKKKIKLSHFL